MVGKHYDWHPNSFMPQFMYCFPARLMCQIGISTFGIECMISVWTALNSTTHSGSNLSLTPITANCRNISIQRSKLARKIQYARSASFRTCTHTRCSTPIFCQWSQHNICHKHLCHDHDNYVCFYCTNDFVRAPSVPCIISMSDNGPYSHRACMW